MPHTARKQNVSICCKYKHILTVSVTSLAIVNVLQCLQFFYYQRFLKGLSNNFNCTYCITNYVLQLYLTVVNDWTSRRRSGKPLHDYKIWRPNTQKPNIIVISINVFVLHTELMLSELALFGLGACGQSAVTCVSFSSPESIT